MITYYIYRTYAPCPPTFDLCWLPHPPRRWSPSNIRSKVQTLPSFPSLLFLSYLPFPFGPPLKPSLSDTFNLPNSRPHPQPTSRPFPNTFGIANTPTRPTPKSSNPPFRNYQYLSRPFRHRYLAKIAVPQPPSRPFPTPPKSSIHCQYAPRPIPNLANLQSPAAFSRQPLDHQP